MKTKVGSGLRKMNEEVSDEELNYVNELAKKIGEFAYDEYEKDHGTKNPNIYVNAMLSAFFNSCIPLVQKGRYVDFKLAILCAMDEAFMQYEEVRKKDE